MATMMGLSMLLPVERGASGGTAPPAPDELPHFPIMFR
jgi:hypothetical protein